MTTQFAMPEGLRKRWLASIFMYRGCGIPANGGLFGFPSNSHGQSVHAICNLPTIKWAFFWVLTGNLHSSSETLLGVSKCFAPPEERLHVLAQTGRKPKWISFPFMVSRDHFSSNPDHVSRQPHSRHHSLRVLKVMRLVDTGRDVVLGHTRMQSASREGSGTSDLWSGVPWYFPWFTVV